MQDRVVKTCPMLQDEQHASSHRNTGEPQSILNPDPAAEIPEEEAAQIVAQQEAGFVERLVGTSSSPVSEIPESEEDEEILLPATRKRNPTCTY